MLYPPDPRLHLTLARARGERVAVELEAVRSTGPGPLRRAVARLLLAVVMALQLCVYVALTEDREQAFVNVRREADQALGEFGQLIESGRALAFFGAQFHAGDQAAQVPVPRTRFHQQRIGNAVGAGDLRTDVRAHARLLGGHVKTR